MMLDLFFAAALTFCVYHVFVGIGEIYQSL